MNLLARKIVSRCSIALAATLAMCGGAGASWAGDPVCGNGVIEAGEACDDGNLIDGDGCSSACTVEQQCYDAGNTFSFFTWSDSYTGGSDTGIERVLADAVNSAAYPARVVPRFWFGTGDIPYMGVSYDRLDVLNRAISDSAYPFTCDAGSRRFPWFVAVGNHDVDGTAVSPMYQYDYWSNYVGPRLPQSVVGMSNFRWGPDSGHDARTTYSFDYKNAHFVVLNQYFGDPAYPTANPVGCIRAELSQWIEQDLAGTNRPVRFVFGHEPAWSYCSNLGGFGGSYCPVGSIDNQDPPLRPRPYSTTGDWPDPFGLHWGDSLEGRQCPQGSRDAFWAMLARHNVVASFAGHNHSYSARLIQGDGTRRNDIPAYGKEGLSLQSDAGVWEVNTGKVHTTSGALYVLTTVRDNVVTFESYDQRGYTEPFALVESWSVNVGGGPTVPVNSPPVLWPVGNKTADVGIPLTFTASATDPDAGQTLAYSLVGAPAGASIDPARGAFAWTPTPAQAGAATFTVRVTDSGIPALFDEEYITVTVNASLPPGLSRLQHGISSLPAGSDYVTVTIPAVDPAKAFLVFGCSFDDGNPGFGQVSGTLTNSTTLSFRRASGGPGAPWLDVEWYVAEFAGGVAVQRGSSGMAAATNGILNVPIDPVDTSRSFPLISFRNAGAMYSDRDFVKARVASPTNLELSVGNMASPGGVVEWQVVQYGESAVQTGELSIAASKKSKEAKVSYSEPGKSWLIVSWRGGGRDAGSGIGQIMVRGRMKDGTTLTFEREKTGCPLALTWYLVEFLDGTSVRRGTAAFGAAASLIDVPLSPGVDPSRSIAVASGLWNRGGTTAYSADDNPGVATVRMDPSAGTSLRLIRGASGYSPANVNWSVVTFEGAAAPGP